MRLKVIIVAVVATAALDILVFPPLRFLTPLQSKVAALCLMTISLWATGIIPQHITALLFFLVALVFSLAPQEVVLSGFTSSAVWLIFGGLVIGAAITSTGLGNRVGRLVAKYLHGSYLKIISGLVISGICFSFLMPSAMSRVVLLVPIAVAIADHFGFEHGSRGRTGVILAVILGSFLPAFAILPANVPNMVLTGMSERLFHICLLYGPYLFLHFPVLGILKGLVIIMVIVWLYPDTPRLRVSKGAETGQGLSRDERILTLVLLALLALWMTDFIHHVSPAWVALAGAIFLMLPGIAIVDKKLFNQKINWASIIFVAGILGLGAVISQSGTGHSLARQLITVLPKSHGGNIYNFFSYGLAAAITGVFTTLPGVPAVFTPLSDTLAHVSSMPIKSIIMLQVVGFSTVFFPYQAPPIVVGVQLSGERFVHAAKLCLVISLITIFLLFPLDYLWWKVLGWI